MLDTQELEDRYGVGWGFNTDQLLSRFLRLKGM